MNIWFATLGTFMVDTFMAGALMLVQFLGVQPYFNNYNNVLSSKH